ncbi:MAG TPA: hypothetical protein VNJ07_08375 [Chitinophagales bacterium]|nr:hypothetical protein [Chitinophagales bacterium]
MATKKAKANAKVKAKAVSKAEPREALRKLFLAGIGLADETNTRLQQAFNSLVKKGQVKEPQVKKAVADIRKKANATRKDLEKKFSAYIKQSELLKARELREVREKLEKELQQVKKNWEKKFSDYAKKSELLKSKEVQELRKKLETWQAKAKEWEAKAKAAAKKAMATPIAEEKAEKKWETPQPAAQPKVEKTETPLASSEVTPSAEGVPISKPVTEEPSQQE